MNAWHVVIIMGIIVSGFGGTMGWVGKGADGEVDAAGFKQIVVKGPPWIVVLIFGMLLAVGGAWRIDERSVVKGKEDEPIVTAPPTTPPPAEMEDEFPNGFTYGDNHDLDKLWRECERGVMVSCDDLYVESDEGTDYEYFGYSCGDVFFDPSVEVGWCDPETVTDE